MAITLWRELSLFNPDWIYTTAMDPIHHSFHVSARIFTSYLTSSISVRGVIGTSNMYRRGIILVRCFQEV